MTYERFDRWIKRNKFFSAILIFLFITGVTFQATDTFTRIKSMLTGETENVLEQNSYKILNFNDRATFAFTNEAFEDNVQVNEDVEVLLIRHEEPIFDGRQIGPLIESSDNEIWLVNLELTDAVPTEVNGKPVDEEIFRGLRQEMGFSISFYTPDPSGEGRTLINLHFPQIDTNYQWSDFNHTALSSSYGISQSTAFYRLTRFKQRGIFSVNFKAEYIVPDADKARNSMTLLAKMRKS